MTKMKSKKMTKSTFAIIIMAIAMVAMLAFGGTYAFFTSGTAFTKSIGTGKTLGTIALTEAETTLTTTSLLDLALPGEKLFKEDATLSIKDASNRSSYIFVEVDYSVTLAGQSDPVADSGMTLADTFTGFQSFTDTTSQKTVYYKLTGTAYNDQTEITPTAHSITGINIVIPTTWGNTYQGATVTLSFTVKSIQSAGFETAQAAYTAYTPNGIPA